MRNSPSSYRLFFCSFVWLNVFLLNPRTRRSRPGRGPASALSPAMSERGPSSSSPTGARKRGGNRGGSSSGKRAEVRV